jgi:FAD:protein FMN transferase
MARAHREFRSMGCEVVVVGASPRELRAVARLFEQRDRTFSRFRRDSELNRVNAGAGRPVRVSATFAEMLRFALDAQRETGGLVDPTIGAALEAAGYDTDFSQLVEDARPPGPAATGSRAVRLVDRTVLVPYGVRLDLNGVVKGRTVDDALALLGGSGFISAGGDLAARGGLVVALPRGGAVSLVHGALATSGIDRRSWVRGGRVQHHLIDARAGLPASSPWQQVTVCAGTCAGADVAAKAAFLIGPAGPAWLDAHGMPGRFVTPAGVIRTNRTWQASLEKAA